MGSRRSARDEAHPHQRSSRDRRESRPRFALKAGGQGCRRDRHMSFLAEINDRQGMTVVTLVGELDVYSAATLRTRLTALLDDGTSNLVVNMAQLAFIDSTGLGTLVTALKRARADGGDLTLEAVPASAMRVLELTGLNRVF